MDPIELSLFTNRMASICTEMGAILQKTALSPNIKDRLDFSCAVFDHKGALCSQAAHIPVHLGSMAYAMKNIVNQQQWHHGDALILNDPYLGGTHLPDITIISPVFFNNELIAFVANRAHYADIGASSPGSMPLATQLDEEGLIISPSFIQQQGETNNVLLTEILSHMNNPGQVKADLIAQISVNQKAVERLQETIEQHSASKFTDALVHLNNYAERLARTGLKNITDGQYAFIDTMDDDGQGNENIPIQVRISVKDGNVLVDFNGTSQQVAGNINCPVSVTAAAVFYCFYALMPSNTPACSGSFRSIEIKAPNASLVNAQSPAAVAAGNVETSTRIVDVILGALAKALPERIPAASHGSMNNIAMGNQNWDYYETLGGGMGASCISDGQDAIQTHMTNTLNTPIEILEMQYPLRIHQYAIRMDSGGSGKFIGGDGLIREYEFLEETTVSLLTERRLNTPWGLSGGQAAKRGHNYLNNETVPGKISFSAKVGDRLLVSTPGGGGWGM